MGKTEVGRKAIFLGTASLNTEHQPGERSYDPTSQGAWRLTILDVGEIIGATRTLRRTEGATQQKALSLMSLPDKWTIESGSRSLIWKRPIIAADQLRCMWCAVCHSG